MTLRYLLDENVNLAYQEQLLRRNPNLTVLAIGEPGVPPKSTPDPEILCWCEEHHLVLITNNRASMPVHLTDHLIKDRHVPGIFILNAVFILNADYSMGQMLEELLLIAETALAGEYQDVITHLPVIR